MRSAGQPALTGILETALYVADLDRSARFYAELLGGETLLADERMRAIDVAGVQVLLLFLVGASDRENPVPGGTVPAHDGGGRLHVAFAVPAASLPAWEARLTDAGIAVESRVHPPQGGASLYFRDPDGHLVELATPDIWRKQ
jgi:catechol 2,3-dioxygenase-like lactoylglutathione lyase family enzyme